MEKTMADANNSGQFGNREDNEEQDRKGGEANPRNFGRDQDSDPSEAGRMGTQAQPHAAKVEGGQHSQRNEGN
jgi:general stress protein YciG